VGDPERLSICVVTYERSAFLRRCVESLLGDIDANDQIVIVDASKHDEGEALLALAPGVVYVHAPELAGWMTKSRNEALRHATGTIIAFLDDDVVVHPGWRVGLLAAFSDQGVAAVAGRTRNGQPGEDEAAQPIGRLLSDGSLTAEFAARTESVVEIDHGIGANMSFRRSVLAELGGFRDDYPGTAMREDTDVFLRVGRLGQRAVFAPEAVVDHLPAPHVRGTRFDLRYELYGRRNHMVLLARDKGIRSLILRRWILREFRGIGRAPKLRSKTRRLAVSLGGVLWGGAAMVRQARWAPMSPQRTDQLGDELRHILSEVPAG
jgi:GT2 family glycosyltransferase